MGTKQLVVIDGDPSHDWCKLFEGCTLSDGSSIRVVQASWLEVALTHYSGASAGGCMLSIAPVRESEGKIVRPQTLGVKPDFILVRNQPRGPTPGSDKRNILYGLMSAGVPSINSLESIYMCLERPIMFGALQQIEKRVGHQKFPLISQNYYSGHNQMIIGPDMPCILKVSHAHAGMGKVKLDDMTAFKDLSTVMALWDSYCTAEPFIDAEYGIRVQKIGNSYRVMKKIFTGSGWKSHFGGASLHEIPLTEEYKLWVDECAKCFGGMDILAVDALHGLDGKDYIIELNDTAIGILTNRWEEDSHSLRDLTLDKMDAVFCKDTDGVPPDPSLLETKSTVTSKATPDGNFAFFFLMECIYRGERPDNLTKPKLPAAAEEEDYSVPWREVVLTSAISLSIGIVAGYLWHKHK